MKEPPDKYKTIKTSLKSIIRPNIDLNKLDNVIDRTHLLTIHVYQFLRLWILDKYRTNVRIPIITIETIRTAYKVLSTSKRGPKNKQEVYNEFIALYDIMYTDIRYTNKVSGVNLSGIIGYMVTDILTNIENNIKQRFENYVRHFVNSFFPYNKSINIKKHEKELYEIKQDLFNNTNNSNPKYRNWLNKYRTLILPTNIDYKKKLESEPQMFLKYMITMNLELEVNRKKSLQFFPLRNSHIPKNIPIDTKVLIELFVDNKTKYLSDIAGTKQEIWNKYFKLNDKIFNNKQLNKRLTNNKQYVFDYSIMTDGMSVSIRYINQKYVEKERQKHIKRKAKKNLTKHLTKKEKATHKKTKEESNKRIKEADYDRKKSYVKQMIKRGTLKKQKEFPNIEDLSATKLETLKTANIVYIDPGKNQLLYMLGTNGKYFRYTQKQRLFETKQNHFARLLNNYVNKSDINRMIYLLSTVDSRTCMVRKFMLYMKIHQRLLSILLAFYKKKKFRESRLSSYIYKQRSESIMMNNIEKTYKSPTGESPIIIIGDWNGNNNLKHSQSTKGIGLKRKLKGRFELYEIDEYNTSKLCYKTGKPTKNLKIRTIIDNKRVTTEIQPVLTYQMSNQRYGCINRDRNAVNNMKNIATYYMIHGCRPVAYQNKFKSVIEPIARNPQKVDQCVRKLVTRETRLLNDKQVGPQYCSLKNKTGIQSKVKSKVKPPVKPKVKPQIQSKVKPQIQSKVKTPIQSKVKTQIQSKVKQPPKVQNKLERL